MFKKLLVIAISFAILLSISASPVHATGSTGAIFTTDSACIGININIFGAKEDVYVDGGPAHTGAAGLPDGEYYVQVTQPDGTLLGSSISSGTDTPVHVTSGAFNTCYQLSSILIKASDGTPGFDTTGNPGGEYKVWVSMDNTFPNNLSKTDNFKVKGIGPTPTPVPRGELMVQKFYDKNANGIFDGGEPLLTGWKIHIQDTIDYIRYTLVDIFLDPDDYTITEFAPIETNWFSSTTNPSNTALSDGDVKTVSFGNYCTVPSGALSKGFWTNKNGQVLFTNSDRLALIALNLRNANGSNFDPATYASFKTWLGSASATNMANMLSAQLAAMKLNVLHSFADGNAFYIPYGGTINQLMAAADAQLGANSLTLAGNPNRSPQEILKNYLDALNNGASVVPTTPCAFSFAE